jgi:hypothetical protein
MGNLSLSSVVLATLGLASGVFGAIYDLSQLECTLKNQNGSIQIPASGPPSYAHLDLVKAGIITEPLLGINGKGGHPQLCLQNVTNSGFVY